MDYRSTIFQIRYQQHIIHTQGRCPSEAEVLDKALKLPSVLHFADSLAHHHPQPIALQVALWQT
jgi:hypothetical protein